MSQISLILAKSTSWTRTISQSEDLYEAKVTEHKGMGEVIITYPSDVVEYKVERVRILWGVING